MKRTNPPGSLKDVRVEFWTKRLNSMLEDRNRAWAKETLQGIKDNITRTDKISDKQIRAIKNIQNGRNPITN